MGRIPEIPLSVWFGRSLPRRIQAFIYCVTAALTLSVMGLAGCATWGSAPDASLSKAETDQADPVEPGTGYATDESTLNAIEEFLARTASYEVVGSPASAYTEVNEDENSPSLDARDLLDRTGSGGFGKEDALPKSRPTESLSDTRNEPSDGAPFAKRDDEALANTRMSLPANITSSRPATGKSQPSGDKPALPTLLSVSVREAVADPSTSSPTSPHHATNMAIDVNDRPVMKSIDDWLDEWKSQSENGRDFQAEWRLRLTQLALGRSDEAYEFAPQLSGETRTLLSGLFQTIEAVRDLAQNPLLTGERGLSQLTALRHILANRADLIIAHVALCRRVVTFGVYEEMEPAEFVSGRSVQTIVYSEIENFSAKRQADSAPSLEGGLAQHATQRSPYETKLSTRIEVFTVDGVSMWSKQEPEIVDRCRRRRTDFFLAQLVTLPPTLPAGEYVMKVYVEDKLSGKAAERTIPFEMLSPLSVAQRR